jgi:hypothetical protein
MRGGELTEEEQELVMNPVGDQKSARQVVKIIKGAVGRALDDDLDDLLFISEYQKIGPDYLLEFTDESVMRKVLDAVSRRYDVGDLRYLCEHIERNPSDPMFSFLKTKVDEQTFDSILFHIRNPETLRTFGKHGGDINALKNGRNYLTEKARTYDLVLAAIDLGINVNFLDTSGECPLYVATSLTEDTKVVELLVDRGADVNLVNFRGNSVLAELMRGQSFPGNECIFLLKKGAVLDPAKLSGNVSTPEQNPYIKHNLSILSLGFHSYNLAEYIISHPDKFGNLIDFSGPNGTVLNSYLREKYVNERLLGLLLDNSSDLKVQLLEPYKKQGFTMAFLRQWSSDCIREAHNVSALDRTSAVVGKDLPKGLPPVFKTKSNINNLHTDIIRTIVPNVLNRDTLRIALKIRKFIKNTDEEERRKREERSMMADEDIRLPSDSPKTRRLAKMKKTRKLSPTEKWKEIAETAASEIPGMKKLAEDARKTRRAYEHLGSDSPRRLDELRKRRIEKFDRP